MSAHLNATESEEGFDIVTITTHGCADSLGIEMSACRSTVVAFVHASAATIAHTSAQRCIGALG